MDIDLLSKMVKELILDNDRVVLPGLGCFVTEIVPATFSDRGYTLNPPYRKLYFRKYPDEGVVLAELYAKSNGVNVDIAGKILRSFIAEMKTVLLTRKTVVFPGLGRMRATKENNIFFVADEDLDIYPMGFALETISMKSHKEGAEKSDAAINNLKSMMAGIRREEVRSQLSVESQPSAGPFVPSEEIPAVPVSVSPEPLPVSVPDSVGGEKESPVEEILQEIPVPEQQPAGQTAVVEQSGMEGKRKRQRGFLVAACVLLGLCVLVVAAFFLTAYLAPDFMDSLLYTEEELKIINY